MSEGDPGLPKSEYLERYDGTRWRIFELFSGGKLILTTRGQELMAFNPDLRRLLLEYRNEARLRKSSPNGVRIWFKAGGNSDVYELDGRPFVIKEASTAHSLWSAIDRMDYLHGICEKLLPPHIRVPDHYGILYSNDMGRLRKQYMLIQKVNDGVTVADLTCNNTVDISDGIKKLVLLEFEGLEKIVQDAIEGSPGRERMPNNLLPDWDAGNIVVDLTMPTKTMPFTFWIIDQ